jgi:N-acetylneuraminic acid mutarotase
LIDGGWARASALTYEDNGFRIASTHRPVSSRLRHGFLLGILCALGEIATAAPSSSWERLAPLPVGNGGFVGGAIEGAIVVAGGTTWKDDTKYWLDQTWVYDSRRNAWHEAGRLPAPVGYGVAGQDVDTDTVWIAGGSTGSETHHALWKIERGLKPVRVA